MAQRAFSRAQSAANACFHMGFSHPLEPQVILFVTLLLLIYFAFFFTGFFNSPFWIPCLLVMLCVIVGRSAYYLRRAREEATTGLNAKEALGIVLKRLKSSILYALIPAVLFY